VSLRQPGRHREERTTELADLHTGRRLGRGLMALAVVFLLGLAFTRFTVDGSASDLAESGSQGAAFASTPTDLSIEQATDSEDGITTDAGLFGQSLADDEVSLPVLGRFGGTSSQAETSPMGSSSSTSAVASSTTSAVATASASANASSYTLTWSTDVNAYESSSARLDGAVVGEKAFYVFLSSGEAWSVTWNTDGGVRVYVDDGYPWRERVRVSELGKGEHVITATVDGSTVVSATFTLGSTTVAAPSTTAVVSSTTTTSAVVTTTAAGPVVSGGVAVFPGDSLQAVVDAYPAGTTFVIKAGVHRRQQVVPKGGDVFVGESGAVLTGEGVTEYAFGAKSVSNVTIRGLVIEKYAAPVNQAAIRTFGGANNWTIEDNEIRYNLGSGIRSGGSGWRIIGNYLHHNQVYGVTGTGMSGLVVEGNEIAFNNYQGTAPGSAGGSKWSYTHGLVVRDNYVHDNVGNGLWTDGHNDGVIYEGNLAVNNTASGIQHEASCSAVIRNNTAIGNAFHTGAWLGAGIRVALSPDVEIYGNTVKNNANGITGVYAHRDNPDTWCPGPDGQHMLANLWVHDNTIIMPTGQSGVVANASYDQVFGSWNNRFDHNTYTIGNTAKPFEWQGDRTITEWLDYSQDTHSSFN